MLRQLVQRAASGSLHAGIGAVELEHSNNHRYQVELRCDLLVLCRQAACVGDRCAALLADARVVLRSCADAPQESRVQGDAYLPLAAGMAPDSRSQTFKTIRPQAWQPAVTRPAHWEVCKVADRVPYICSTTHQSLSGPSRLDRAAYGALEAHVTTWAGVAGPHHVCLDGSNYHIERASTNLHASGQRQSWVCQLARRGANPAAMFALVRGAVKET